MTTEAITEAEATRCPFQGGEMELAGGESRLDPFIRNNPFPFYRTLRRQEPVYFDEKLDVWLITRYDDVEKVLRDDVNFSMERGYQERWASGHAEELEEILRRESGVFVRDPAIDPPAHTRIRKLIEKAFTGHRVKSLEPRIRSIIVDLIESIADQGHAEGRIDIGVGITARVMCDQLGFDFEEVRVEKIYDWTTAWLAQMGRMQSHEEMLANSREIVDLQKYVVKQIRSREKEPREDMTSDLVHAVLEDEDNARLSFEEQVAWVRGLLIGGNDSTATGITNLVMVLATRPDLAQALAASVDDDRAVTRFVEEMLRLEPPAHGLYRTTTQDVEVGGVLIPADAQVCILYASANDDDKVFPNPREFDETRANSGRSMTFGVGIHRCVGAALARMEIKIAAQEMCRRLDDIRLAIPIEQLRYLPTLGTQTLESVPITFRRRV